MIPRSGNILQLLAFAVLLSSVLTQNVPAVFGDNGPSNVRISTESFQNSQSIPTINWDSASTNNLIYCIGSSDIQELRFFCADCNATDGGINELIAQYSVDRSSVARYPLLMINKMPVTEALDGKILQCDGRTGNQGTSTGADGVVKATARVQVRYLSVPIIVDSEGRRPLTQPGGGGNTIYLPCQRQTNQQGQQSGPCVPTSSVTLQCQAKGNPQPAVTWTSAGGSTIGTGSALTIQASNALNIGSVQCISQSPSTQFKEYSTSVRLMIYERPTLYQNNFEQVSSSSEFVGQQARLNAQFTLECSAYGNPKPVIFWRQTRQGSLSSQDIYNITCPQGAASETSQQTATPQGSTTPVAIVTSQCQVSISNYSMQGDFWCAPCVEIAEGAYDCGTPNRNETVPSPTAAAVLPVNVVGEPQKLRDFIAPEGNDQILQIDYCADPKPATDAVTWVIDGIRIRPGNTYENLEAAAIENLAYFTDCYTAKLRMRGTTDADKDRRYQLEVQNSFQTVLMGADVRELLSGGRQPIYTGLSGWWIALIVLCALMMVLCVICCVCAFMRRMFCFSNQQKRLPTTTSSSKNDPPKDKYLSNVAPTQLSAEPQAYRAPPMNPNPAPGYNPTPQPENYGYGASPAPRLQEGYNYAELDLAPEYPTAGGRNAPPRPPPVDYAQLRPQQQLHSAL